MSERGLEFESALLGWLTYSPVGRREFLGIFSPVLEHEGANAYVQILHEHGLPSAAARLRELVHVGKVEAADAEAAIRWAKQAPDVDDEYMLTTARQHLKARCYAIHAAQAAKAAEIWDDSLVAAANAELKDNLAKLVVVENSGFTAAGVAKAFGAEENSDLFSLPGYVGRVFKGRCDRGSLIAIQAQPKTGKSAVLVRMAVAAIRYGNRVLHVSIGDQDQYEAAARIISCESQRNGMVYVEGRQFVPVSCCARAKAGCDKECFAAQGYRPLSPPVPAQYLDESEVEAILKAFPSFAPCTLCRGTPDYVPSIWWQKATTAPLTEKEAIDIYESIVSCGEYGRIETLFYGARQITVSGLSALVDKRKETGTPVDVLVVDYADMIGLDSYNGKAKWEKLQFMWEELRALAATQNILILTATQGNRGGGSMQTQDSTTVAGTRASVDNCTLVVALNQTPAERARGVIRVSEVAARKGSFAPEHQAECISRMDIQDPLYDSWHKWVKTDTRDPT